MSQYLTKKGLDKINKDALNFLKVWVKYLEDLGDFTIEFNKAGKIEGIMPPKPPEAPSLKV